MLQSVVNTNVVLAGKRSRALTSLNEEMLRRWGRREFDAPIADNILKEYTETLLGVGTAADGICAVITGSGFQIRSNPNPLKSCSLEVAKCVTP